MTRNSESRSEMVARRLRSAIIRGNIRLGEALSEDTLAEVFSVSRTPIREALRRLEVQGLVELRPKSITKVFEPTTDQIGELSDLRSVIENRAAELAFELDRRAAAAELSAVLIEMEKCIDGHDMSGYGEADTKFHEVFYRYCGNRYIKSVYDLNLAQVAALRTNLASHSPNEPHRSFEEHREIVRIFGGSDVSGLRDLLHQHIHRTSENYVHALEQIYSTDNSSRVEELKRALKL